MGFERFVKYRTKRIIKRNKTNSPFVSIFSKGQLRFSVGACELFDLQKFKSAVLYYDKENNNIGIQLNRTRKTKDSHKICKYENTMIIHAEQFLKHYNINHKETNKYYITYDGKKHFLSIKLSHQKDNYESDTGDETIEASTYESTSPNTATHD